MGRRIFTENSLTELLLPGMTKQYDMSINDLANKAIENYFLPVNELLKKETNYLYHKLLDGDITPEEMKACMARSVTALKDSPIKDYAPLEQIMLHYTNTLPMVHRYDYIQIVDTLQDERLHKLNEILKTLDKDFTLGTREFGERSRYIFKYWNDLYVYPEIYVDLGTIIECEKTYRTLDIYRAIMLIKWLDDEIRKSNCEPAKDEFKTNISLADKYYGLRYEIITYHTDNGYAELSGDVNFANMSDAINEYYKDLDKNHLPYGRDITQEDYESLLALEAEGRRLFRRLGGHPRRPK